MATLLLELRLRAFATSDALAESTGMSVADVGGELVALEGRRFVQLRDGRIRGWTLTAEGRRWGQHLLVGELDSAGARAELDAAYRDFLPLNAELLAICTDWQTVVVDGAHVPNDHSDATRDAAVIDRLDVLHPAAMELALGLGRALPRFGRYGRRLDEAYANVAAGNTEWLTRVNGSSYHGVWFELHEHLLATLERTREAEPVPSYTPTAIDGASVDRRGDGCTENGDPT